MFNVSDRQSLYVVLSRVSDVLPRRRRELGRIRGGGEDLRRRGSSSQLKIFDMAILTGVFEREASTMNDIGNLKNHIDVSEKMIVCQVNSNFFISAIFIC